MTTLITGAAKGLGAEIARVLSKKGHSVLIHYCSSEKEAKELANECSGQIIKGDFSSQKKTEDFLKHLHTDYPPISYLVNNVGNHENVSLLNTPKELWYALMETNLHAPFLITKELAPNLKKIVNIGVTGLGRSRAVKEAIAYTVTKEALWALTLSLAKELSRKATVNMVSPGELENSKNLSLRERLSQDRPGKLSEVADLVAYLLSPEADYITGQNISIDGGMAL